jgi:hypothetical protein
MNSFYERYKHLGKEELIEIVLSPADYIPEAIEAARQVIIDNRWSQELAERLKQQTEIDEEEQKAFEEDVVEKADYYRRVVEIKSQNNYFFIRVSHIPEFEGKLVEHNIEFYREDKHIGPQIDNYPTQAYYFRHEDVKAVDEIVKEIGLITTPYHDVKPGFKMELIILGFVILFVVLAVIFLS